VARNKTSAVSCFELHDQQPGHSTRDDRAAQPMSHLRLLFAPCRRVAYVATEKQ
jgi:hypothetical protein